MTGQNQSIEINLGQDRRLFVLVERKRVKNLRLKVYPSGEVKVSAPVGLDYSKVAEFVTSKSEWIKKILKKKQPVIPVPGVPDFEIAAVLFDSVDRLYPIVEAMGVKKPSVTIRRMKTRWGSCSVNKNSIRLNSSLYSAPKECIDYVVLHELAHFLYPDHSENFYGFIERFMPDWKRRREALKCMRFPE
ncbi:MAG: SprT-like family protein [Firmicutes bacterium ADurb.Bin182]|nr:MAG: SprT-like family protein [Firmicutes bacterium ADurb.Bin182]